MVKVSAIIQIYDNNANIEKCLNSLLSQTLDEYEIIIIDNSSGDALKEFKNNKSIKLIKSVSDIIKSATGEYLTFIDVNDYIDENMLGKYYEFAKKNDLDLLTSTYNQVVKGKIKDTPMPKFKIGNIKTSPQILISIEYNLWAKLFKREMLIKNNISFMENIIYNDVAFICNGLLKSRLVGFLKDAYYYRVIDKSNNYYISDSIFNNLKKIKEDYKKEFYLKNEIDYIIISKTIEYMANQKDKELRKQFINVGYDFLNNNVKEWKNNKYYKETSFSKKIIQNNKKLFRKFG